MSGGGGNTQTIRENADPWHGIQPHLLKLYGGASSAFNQTPTTPFSGDMVAQPNSSEFEGLNIAESIARSMGSPGDSVMQLGQDMASGYYLNSNPHLDSAISAATRPLMQDFTDRISPALKSQAIMEGAYGGDAEGVSQALAAERIAQQIADVSSQMSFGNYRAERDLQMQAPGLIQAGVGLNLLPADILGAAGQARRGYDQLGIDNELAKFTEQQNAPWRRVDRLAAALSGFGGLGGSSTASSTSPQASPWLSGAIGGLGMGGSIGALTGAATFPALAPFLLGGAALGGLLGGIG